MTSEIFEVIQIGVGVALLWVLYAWLWRDYREEKLRFSLYLIRDKLFDDWHAMNMDYSDPAYCLVRDSLNALARFAHRITFFGLAMPLIVSKHSNLYGTRTIMHLMASIEGLPEDGQKALRNSYSNMLGHIALHIVLGAPLLVPVLMVAVGVTVLKRLTPDDIPQRISKRLRQLWENPAGPFGEWTNSRVPAINMIPQDFRAWKLAELNQ